MPSKDLLPHAFSLLLALAATRIGLSEGVSPPQNPILKKEFIYTEAPFPSCHASTLIETKRGEILAAFFGGTDEGMEDVGIWTAHYDGKAWSPPVEVADGISPDGKRHPCWNPVLFQAKKLTLLFYKVGPRPDNWWGMLKTSTDGGRTWSEAKRLPDGILGPVKNKPVLLKDGTLLCGSSSEDKGWRAHVEMTKDWGETWTHSDALNDGKAYRVIQPTILLHPRNRVQMLCRSREGKIVEFWSQDGGKTWGDVAEIDVPNPNSGIDAVNLKGGRLLMIYNHTKRGRSPINVGLSKDGRTWTNALALETAPGEYSYPAVIQAADGLVHVTYTWKRKLIRHVVLDPKRLP